jgi:hypothetical protein
VRGISLQKDLPKTKAKMNKRRYYFKKESVKKEALSKNELLKVNNGYRKPNK